MATRVLGLVLISLGLFAVWGEAEEWTGARIRQLPDSAFAVVETAPDGRTARHLPHHDETGGVDPAHLRAARARLNQVRWFDPANQEVALRHLDEHWREVQAPAAGLE